MKKKTLSILCTEEQRNQIKLLAKKENLTLSNFVLSKLLNLKPVKEDIIKECPMTIVDKKGKKKYI